MTRFPERLTNGYAAFRDGRLAADRDRYRRLADRGQRPEIMIVACCDSRSAPETIFDAAPGEMFVHRNVANLVPPYEVDGHQHGTSAALEFGVTALKVRHLVIMGHGRCGGVEAYLSNKPLGGTDFIGPWIGLLSPAADLIADDPVAESDHQRALEFASISQGIANLRSFPWVRAAEDAGALTLHGAWFDIGTGELLTLDETSGKFTVLA
jgi:carbonic anhydrase